MNLLVRLFTYLVILLIAIVAIAYILPLDMFIPQVQRVASEKLGQRVTVDTLKIIPFPRPYFLLDTVKIGENAPITIKMIKVKPDVSSLFESVKVIEKVEMDGITLNDDGWKALPALVGSSRTVQTTRIEHMAMRGIRMNLKGASVGPFDGEMVFQPTGAISEAVITSSDKALVIQITPSTDGYLFEAFAKNWRIPVEPQFMIDSMTAQGSGNLNEVVIKEIAGGLYNGNFIGNGSISWGERWTYKADVKAKRLQLKNLANVLKRKPLIEGDFSCDCVFNATADSADRLLPNTLTEGDFSISRGMINNMDIAHVIKTRSRVPSRGGNTSFENLAGKVTASNNTYQFRQLGLTSGILHADGKLNVAADEKVTGNLSVRIKNSATVVKIPLNISGTVTEPVLQVGR